MSGILVTGTDTDVGKTYVACLIARELARQKVSFRVFKPAVSGATRGDCGVEKWSDLEALADASGQSVESISPFRFKDPLAPNVAARTEGCSLSFSAILEAFQFSQAQADHIIVEGVGGLLCPLTDDKLVADFAMSARLPILIVARLGLGTINHTLLTIDAALNRGMPIAGIILSDSTGAVRNDPSVATNLVEIERISGQSVLGVVEHGGTEVVSASAFSSGADQNTAKSGVSADGHGYETGKIDWISLAEG